MRRLDTGGGGERAASPEALEEGVEGSRLTPLDRRAFLRLGALAGAAGLLPSGCGPPPPHLAPPEGVALEVLSPRTYAALTAAAMRIVGPAGAVLIRERRVDPARMTDRMLARSPGLAGPLAQALLVLELAVHPLLAKWRPFSALGGEAQDRVLDDLMRSRLDLKRDLFNGVKSLVCLHFYAHPASRSLTRYPGPFGGPRAREGNGRRSAPGESPTRPRVPPATHGDSR